MSLKPAPRVSAFQTDRYRHRYALAEIIEVYALALRAAPLLHANRRLEVLGKDFVERIMLAVTEVNGCAVCSYAHTAAALRSGMDGAEISALLSGDDTAIRPEEAKAILFAQHYAEASGHPTRAAHEAVLTEYGPQRTRVIVAAIQVMMLGNVTGLPLSALIARLQRRPYANSTLGYELVGVTTPLLLLPAALARRTLPPDELGEEGILFAD